MNIQDVFLRLQGNTAPIDMIEMDGSRIAMTYSDLVDDAKVLLGGYQAQGIPVGAPLVLQCRSIRQTITSLWGAILGGYVPAVLAIPRDAASRAIFEKALESLEAPWVITDLEDSAGASGKRVLPLRALTRGGPGQVVPGLDDDPGMLQFTSGTTSAPRAAVLTLKNLLEGGIASSVVVRPGVTERYISWLPLSHCFGLIANHLVPLVGGFPQRLIHPACFLRDPAIWVREASAFQATISGLPLFGVEALLTAALPEEADLSAMHICFVGGEDVSPKPLWDLEARLAPLGFRPCTLSPAYGLSETTMGVAYTPVRTPLRVDAFLNDHLRVGDRIFFCEPEEDALIRVSVGVLDACNTVEIRDEEGRVLPEEHLGHVIVRGSNVMKGYYPCHAEAHPGVMADGSFDTGDLGWFRRGWLTIFGRSKNIIIHNGKKYLVTDLERTASGEDEAVVIAQGILTGETQPQLVLFGTGSEDQIREAAKRLAGYWHLSPSYGVCLSQLPVTASGKINRLALSFALEQGDYAQAFFTLGDGPGEALTGKYAEMADVWSQVLGISAEGMGMDTHFVLDLGGDSLGMADLLWRLEKKAGHPVNIDYIEGHLTLGDFTNQYLEIIKED
ncbi:non-ribosomal peptide synthetase [Eubacterium barkeri]|nr:non-ribosomal peptide synthetase [Eubacterium barkeri]